MKITLAHGSGGDVMDELIRDIFVRHFSNPVLDRLEDAAVLPSPTAQIAFTTDSFVVTPLVFKGGDIGKLAVCGTVNDLAMRGAVPKYLSCGFILEEGLALDTLDQVAKSMGQTAQEAGVMIVAGDTKVVEGNGGLYINTAGVGFMQTHLDISVKSTRPGDGIIISGLMGEHHACILSARMGIENDIQSDCAVLNHMVESLLNAGLQVHTLRDITRGGLGTVLNEIAKASHVEMALDGKTALCNETVQGFCDILGLDIMHMGNEGKFALILPMEQVPEALDILGGDARLIGTVQEGKPCVTMMTRGGSKRMIKPLLGEGLPRIC